MSICKLKEKEVKEREYKNNDSHICSFANKPTRAPPLTNNTQTIPLKQTSWQLVSCTVSQSDPQSTIQTVASLPHESQSGKAFRLTHLFKWLLSIILLTHLFTCFHSIILLTHSFIRFTQHYSPHSCIHLFPQHYPQLSTQHKTHKKKITQPLSMSFPNPLLTHSANNSLIYSATTRKHEDRPTADRIRRGKEDKEAKSKEGKELQRSREERGKETKKQSWAKKQSRGWQRVQRGRGQTNQETNKQWNKAQRNKDHKRG